MLFHACIFFPLPAGNLSPGAFKTDQVTIFIYTDTGLFRLSKSEIKILDSHDAVNEELSVDTLRRQEILDLVGDKIGIPANGIKQIFTWNNSEIWILGAYTLHVFHDPSPLKLLETGSANTGRILKSMLTKGRILLGTSRGIFAVSEDEAPGGQWTISSLLPESSHSVHMFSAIMIRCLQQGPMASTWFLKSMQN